MNSIPISAKKKEELIEKTGLSIEFVAKSIDEVRTFIKKVDLIKELLETHDCENNEIFIKFERLLEYRMLIGLVFLDLASSTRAHLNAKYKYECYFSIRQIIVIINEGYKQIYNFLKTSSEGHLITKDRNNSFWIKDIGKIVNSNLTELKDEYDMLTEKLDSYFEENFSSLKEQRNLSIHYDKVASKVYDMATGLNIDEVFRKMIPFLDILIAMFRFTEKIAYNFQIKGKQKNIHLKESIESSLNKIEDLINNAKNEQNNEQMMQIMTLINKTKELFH